MSAACLTIVCLVHAVDYGVGLSLGLNYGSILVSVSI